MARLQARLRRRSELDTAAIARMYALYASHYAATSPGQFALDLAAKSFVIELLEGSALRGFSTVACIDFAQGSKRAIFSGDTVIDQRFWGEQALPRAFCVLAGRIKAAAPALPLFWFLISKGHRTYRYLSAFARTYYPHPAFATPPDVQASIDELATARFGAAYEPRLGVVHFAEPHGHVRERFAEISPALRARREVQFFLERNPGHVHGDELCCLAALDIDNLRALARHAFLAGLHDSEPLRVLSSDTRTGSTLPCFPVACDGDPARVPRLAPSL